MSMIFLSDDQMVVNRAAYSTLLATLAPIPAVVTLAFDGQVTMNTAVADILTSCALVDAGDPEFATLTTRAAALEALWAPLKSAIVELAIGTPVTSAYTIASTTMPITQRP